MKKLILIILTFTSLFSNQSNQIIIDPKFSPLIGAENLITAYEISEFLIKKVFGNKKEKKFINIVQRVAELVFIYQPLSNLEIVLQHEIFGHGYRIRDIPKSIVDVKGYKIDLPFPYADGGGATFFEFNDNLTTFQRSAISIGGVEADAVFANRIKMKWVSNQKLDPLKSILYLNSFHDITAYIYTMSLDPYLVNDGHDIENYIFWLNNTYIDQNLSKDYLKKRALLNFVDPFSYYSLASYFYYIFTGDDMYMPMIKIKNVKYLFNFRIGLAPYGVEYYMDNFFSYKDRPIYVYLKGGSYQSNYFGFGIDYPVLFAINKNAFGFRFDCFYQPKIYYKSAMTVFENVQVGYSDKDLNKNIFGSSIYLMYDRKIPIKDLSFHFEIGYKTKGFIQGESLRDYLNIRLGIASKIF